MQNTNHSDSSELLADMLRLGIVDLWTGHRAHVLQTALRMTNDSFADHLGVAVRTVAKWHANPDVIPSSDMQAALDTALTRSEETAQQRFAFLLIRNTPLSVGSHDGVSTPATVTELRPVLAR